MRAALVVALAACSSASSPGTPDAPAATCQVILPPDGPFCGHGGSLCPFGDGGMGICVTLNGPCVDPLTDVAHCGGTLAGCGPGGACAQGTCVYSSCGGVAPGSACVLAGGGRGACCAGACAAVDFMNDRTNCGGCGIVCPSGLGCSGGSCAMACDFACPGGAATCGTCPTGDVCAAPATSLFEGGMASRACVRASCAGAADGEPCRIAGDPFESGGLCCGGACTQPGADDRNCGACGRSCCAGATCSGRECFPN